MVIKIRLILVTYAVNIVPRYVQEMEKDFEKKI